MTIVQNLATGVIIDYSCSPEDAVIAAYAQERKDWNTWNYRKKYSNLIERGKVSVLCGDWAALTQWPVDIAKLLDR